MQTLAFMRGFFVCWRYQKNISIIETLFALNQEYRSGRKPYGFFIPFSSLARSVFYLKCGTLLRPTLPAIIEPRSRNVRMAQPLLHFGNVSQTSGYCWRTYFEVLEVPLLTQILQLFCLPRRYMGYMNFDTFEFANSIPPFFETRAVSKSKVK